MGNRFRETCSRSAVKAVTWRLTGFLGSVLIVLFFTQDWKMALQVGGIEILVKFFMFYFHERFWDRIQFGKKESKPAVIWLTGLSGAGKTTLAKALELKLKGQGHKVELLDGDEIRSYFPQTGFLPEDRMEHIKRVGYLASRLESAGSYVIVSLISPYREARRFCRGLCQRFIEVYVSTPLEVCEQRDSKGLYLKAREGELKNFTGIDAPYEAPLAPEVEIDTSLLTLSRSVEYIEREIRKTRFTEASSSRGLKNLAETHTETYAETHRELSV